MHVHRGVLVAAGRGALADVLERTGQAEEPQDDQHHANRQLQRQPHPWGNDPSEQDDARADDHDRECVPHPPERTDHRRPTAPPVPSHDGGDRDDMIGIGRVAHAEEESQDDDGEEIAHVTVAAASPRAAPSRASSSSMESLIPLPSLTRRPVWKRYCRRSGTSRFRGCRREDGRAQIEKAGSPWVDCQLPHPSLPCRHWRDPRVPFQHPLSHRRAGIIAPRGVEPLSPP